MSPSGKIPLLFSCLYEPLLFFVPQTCLRFKTVKDRQNFFLMEEVFMLPAIPAIILISGVKMLATLGVIIVGSFWAGWGIRSSRD